MTSINDPEVTRPIDLDKRASRDRCIAGEMPTSQDQSRRRSRIASG